MFDIRHESPLDIPAREALLDRCFGESRLAKTSERLREGRLPAEGLALAATRNDELVGTIRLWDVAAGPGRAAVLLGPVAVSPELQGAGIGGKLIREALGRAADAGHRAVILVGDEAYYRRFGFGREAVAGLWMPGPVDVARFLGLELAQGALAGARGFVSATGRRAPLPDFAALLQQAANEDARRLRAA
ncbi:GNAT family N-acetyltransferase [Enterovirga rhinocerotis]|uniref:Putative N-acetyltransferase YhbS n=1 Tax=Enterovirga rhinocerotis TaxID=1339210 RepID=A0A4V3DWL6_9HYPH|nr:N-acetyltransferase [Enterovirga rhinocerotis]TDR85189.1 putative N-acetyltransferase YhbS [Enterovirga rhinocerotis]